MMNVSPWRVFPSTSIVLWSMKVAKPGKKSTPNFLTWKWSPLDNLFLAWIVLSMIFSKWILGLPTSIPYELALLISSNTSAFFNNDFVSSFTSTDVRNTFYNYYGVPTSLYYAWVTSKFYFAFDSDMILMRSPEMMLIEAESLARTGQEIAAATLLFDLQSNRDANATASGNTGQALIDEILLERRKELYCEIGVEWLDAKRLQQGITRIAKLQWKIAPNTARNS